MREVVLFFGVFGVSGESAGWFNDVEGVVVSSIHSIPSTYFYVEQRTPSSSVLF